MKRPVCPKCGGWLEADRIYMSVYCKICGWRKEFIPPEEKPMTAEDWKQAGVRRNDGSLVNQEQWKPCPVVGCGGKMARRNPKPMCNQCRQLLKQWEKGARTLPPPLILTADGVWMRNERNAT